jgi:signal transduction histidine kinase/DNA-binding response OmpR family regulator/HPt (histidine-containing phosphotransfer) domain-containing protein
MSRFSSPRSLRQSLGRGYRIASIAAGVGGALATLGTMQLMRILEHRGVLTFDNPTIFVTVLAGFLASVSLLSLFVSRRIMRPLERMLHDLNLHLSRKDWTQAIDVNSKDELGLLARNCEQLMREIIHQQNQLEEANDRFQTMIARLSEAKEAAEQADLAKTQFMARMSHEIRTPINGVLGMVDLLLDSNLSESQQRLARIVRDSGQTLLGIVDGLLDFAKLEVDKLVLETTSFNLHKLVEDVVALVAPTAHAKNLDIACCVDPRLPSEVMGDPFRLRQVLTNLIGNAIKFTAEGEVGVDVRLEDDQVCFEISDTGVGIPAEALDRIFEPFAQASVQVSRRFGGTGLGLSIARQLVQLMGGHLRVESSLNVGSLFQFIIHLPAAEGALTTVPVGALAGRRLLLIENGEASARALSTYLTALGVRTLWVTNPTDALEQLRQSHSKGKPFDGIIAAEQAGGLEILRRLQESPLFGHVRVILSATINHIPAIEALPEATQTPILAKPVRREDLTKVLHKLSSTKPLQPRTTVARPVAVAGQRAENPVQAANSAPMILVAEDNPVNSEVIRRMLLSFKYNVDVVENGRLAFEAAQRKNYDLVLMDGQMPEMDGTEAAQAIQAFCAEHDRQCPPIVAVTADAFENARNRYLKAGMDDFITKPFTRADLMALTEKWLHTPEAPGMHPVAGGKDISATAVSGKSIGADAAASAMQGTIPVAKPASEVHNRAEMATSALPVLDRAALMTVAEMGEGEPDFLANIIEIYCRDMAVSLQEMRAAMLVSNLDAMHKLAHKMKSSSANLGARRLAALAARIEKSRQPDAPGLFSQLQTEYRNVYKEMQAVVRETRL